MEPLIRFQNVCKRFGNTKVLNNINFSIYPKTITTVIGKSGVGKSVMLKHIIGLLQPDSGDILYENKKYSEMSSKTKKSLRRRFSYMFQNMALFDSMTVFENIALPLQEKTKLSTNEIANRVTEKMNQLELAHVAEKYPSEISGGMQKRVALARALITDPEIILFDEPTTGLDPIRKNAVFSMISHNQKKFGFTAVIVSHSIPDVFFISHRVAMLEQGEIIFDGTPDDIRICDNPIVNQFINGIESLKDDLTGMDTIAHIQQKYLEETDRFVRSSHPFSIIVFKITNLDDINEMLGHATGQKIIQNVASIVKGYLRVSDIFSRYGWNRILIILPNTNQVEAEKLCKDLVQALIQQNKPIKPDKDTNICFSIHLGVTETKKNLSIEELITVAEANATTTDDFQVCY